MPLRILSGRPRHLQILIASLLVFLAGVATAVGRPAGSPARLEAAAALGVDAAASDGPPPLLASDPPSTTPATDPSTSRPAAATSLPTAEPN